MSTLGDFPVGIEEFGAQIDQMEAERLAHLAAACLERLEPGSQPLPLFQQFLRHTVASIVDVIPVRENQFGQPEVLLAPRPENDPVPEWRGRLHLPGGLLLPSDNDVECDADYTSIASRFLAKEFKGSVEVTGWVKQTVAKRGVTPRGAQQKVCVAAGVSLAEGYTEPVGGSFYSLKELLSPRSDLPVIESHIDTLFQVTGAELLTIAKSRRLR